MNYYTKSHVKVLTLVASFAFIAICFYFAEGRLSQNMNGDILMSGLMNKSPKNKEMLYKLYIVKYKTASEESRSIHHFDEFNKIYKKHGVKVIGVWYNLDDPNESIFMTAFNDEEHYNSFVEEMSHNERYQEMSSELAAERESIKSFNLKMAVSL